MSRKPSLWDTSGNSAEDWRIFEMLCADVKVTSDSKVSSKVTVKDVNNGCES